MYIDDLALNDTTGASDNSWCGEGHVVCLRPSGDSSVQWSRSTGSYNYACVDETVASASDYVYDAGTSGHKDLYDLVNSSLGANPVITRVWHEMVAEDAGATSDQIKGKIDSGGTEYDEDTVTLSSNYKYYKSAARTVDPKTSAGWSVSGLDALKAGVEVV
jgi:hypothetical protein